MLKRFSFLFLPLFFVAILLSIVLCSSAQAKVEEQSACGIEFEKECEVAIGKNTDSAINLCLARLNKIGDKCRVEIYRLLSDCYYTKLVEDKALYYLNKGLDLASKIQYHKESIQICLNFFDYYIRKGEQSKAKEYLYAAANLLNKYPNEKKNTAFWGRKATWFDEINQLDSSIFYMKLSIENYERAKDTGELHVVLHNMGSFYVRKARYKDAIDYLLQSIRYKELVNDKNDLPGTFLMLGNCYKELKQNKTAFEYLNSAKEMSRKIINQEYLYMSYATLAQNASDYLEGDSAMELLYADSAVLLARQSQDPSRIAFSKTVKADLIFFKGRMLLEAEKLSLEALQTFEKLKSKVYICYTSFSLGRYYFKIGKYVTSKVYLNTALQIAKEKSISKISIGANKILSSIYESEGNFKKAFYYHQQFYILNDSLENSKLKSDMAELEKKYNINKKENEIISLNKEKQLKDADLKQSKSRQNFFLITSLLFAVSICISIWAYRKLRNNKNKLALNNTELDNLNQVKNRLFSIIAHDVKGLSVPFQRASRILNHHIQKQNFEKTLEVAKQLETNAESLSNLLDNLLQWSLEQMNGYTPKPEMLSLKNEIAQIMESYEGHAHYKNTQLLQDIPESLLIETDKGAFHVIFRNLVANAIKYTENGSVQIKASKELNGIICHVKDTGTGISAHMLDKLFTIESDKIKNGTAGEKGSGLGLVLVKKFLELNGGTIKVNSIEGDGTDFVISFPFKVAA